MHEDGIVESWYEKENEKEHKYFYLFLFELNEKKERLLLCCYDDSAEDEWYMILVCRLSIIMFFAHSPEQANSSLECTRDASKN